MKSKFKYGLIVIVVASLALIGFKRMNISAYDSKEINNDVIEQVNKEYAEAEDVTTMEEETPVQVEVHADKIGEWASEMKKMLSEPLDDPKLRETNNDEAFEKYLKAGIVVDSFPSRAVEQGSAIREDFSNILSLSTLMGLLQFSRTTHLDPNGGAIEATELYSEWRPASDDLEKVYEKITQIINDIDVKYNKEGEGEVFGVTYSLDGDKVDELEKFIRGE
ncbi:hypothetical protein RBU61_01980 [Tissierella sp. MB52-C2]|uniref:hypothetical protein n=1 Tax=Tissierella sp. MB52-C2 TaxID=3070999 RepID=UPI00280B12AF|nr:hypothetical protein [Tissierella sp. MB52-C2]WMM25454.1 hypothetical protein RBU61_01980 [Tissierella sp. MB52-C2]